MQWQVTQDEVKKKKISTHIGLLRFLSSAIWFSLVLSSRFTVSTDLIFLDKIMHEMLMKTPFNYILFFVVFKNKKKCVKAHIEKWMSNGWVSPVESETALSSCRNSNFISNNQCFKINIIKQLFLRQ